MVVSGDTGCFFRLRSEQTVNNNSSPTKDYQCRTLKVNLQQPEPSLHLHKTETFA